MSLTVGEYVVSALPRSALKLHVLKKNENVDLAGEMEVSAPWKIGWLHDGATRHEQTPWFGFG